MISVRRFTLVGFAFTLAACDASPPADSRESAALTLVPSARYALVSVDGGKCVDIQWSSTADGAPVLVRKLV